MVENAVIRFSICHLPQARTGPTSAFVWGTSSVSGSHPESATTMPRVLRAMKTVCGITLRDSASSNVNGTVVTDDSGSNLQLRRVQRRCQQCRAGLVAAQR